MTNPEPLPLEVERWAAVPTAPGYEVSDRGRVRSVERVVLRSNGAPFRVRARILSQTVDPIGRHAVHVGGRHRRVHGLVMEAFVGPRPVGMECCHADDDPSNNWLRNLRWGTRSDNAYDRVRNGRHHMAKRICCGYGHRLEHPNLDTDVNRRRCLACRRARHRGRRLAAAGIAVAHQELADVFYASIMGNCAEATS